MTTAARAEAPAIRDDVVLCGGANQVAPAEWDRLARRGFHLHRWCSAAERCGWNPRHVGVRGPAGYRAIVPAYLTGNNTLHDLHDRWLGGLRGLASQAGIHLRPVLSVQSPFGQTSEPLGDLSRLPDKILHDIFDRLEQAAELAGAKAIVWPFVDAVCHRVLDIGRGRGYSVHYAGAAARLTIPWASFNEYLTTRSKSVRRTIRADLAAIQAAGLRTGFTSDFRASADAMDRLYREGFRRRNGQEAKVAPGFFAELGAQPSSGSRALLTWAGERLVGTSINLMTPELMEGTMSGFAPEYRAGPVYYNDLCYEPIRLASGEGVAAIDLGTTALYAKVLRGAVLRRRMVLIRGTTPTRHKLLTLLGRLVAQRTEYKERRSLGALWGARCFLEDAQSP